MLLQNSPNVVKNDIAKIHLLLGTSISDFFFTFSKQTKMTISVWCILLYISLSGRRARPCIVYTF